MYKSTKTFGHELGISCAFRQWKSDSHCANLHGYALSFRFVFAASELDERNWVIDFGSFKELKQHILSVFDHKTIIAYDDPLLKQFAVLQDIGALKLVSLPGVGCEKFAEYAYGMAEQWLASIGQDDRVHVESVEVCEHGANSAIYQKHHHNGEIKMTSILDQSEVTNAINNAFEAIGVAGKLTVDKFKNVKKGESNE